MKLPRRTFLHLAAGAAALSAVSRIARAQAYPTDAAGAHHCRRCPKRRNRHHGTPDPSMALRAAWPAVRHRKQARRGYQYRHRGGRAYEQPPAPTGASWGFPAARLSRGSRFRYPAMCSRPVRDRMHFHQWKRRDFITLLGGTAAAWPLASRAQVRRPLVGYLAGAASVSVMRGAPALAFINGLRDQGYVEGRDLDIAWKFADGFLDRLPALAEQLVRLGPDAILAPIPASALAARAA